MLADIVCSSHGLPATKILSNCSPQSERLNVPKFSTRLEVAQKALASSSSVHLMMPRPLSVSLEAHPRDIPTDLTAKFTGYMYGGRPLGLSFVKYTNANGGDMMEGQEGPGGMTQQDMM
jgi:hypothetical protein